MKCACLFIVQWNQKLERKVVDTEKSKLNFCSVIEKDEEIKRSQNCTHKCPNSPGKETDVLTTMTTLTATPTATPPSEHRSLQAPNQRRS